MLLENFVKNQPLVTNFIETMPEELYKRCSIKEFEPRASIYRKDEELRYIYIICSGTVKIMNQFDTGLVYDYAYMDSVDLLGILELLAEQPTSASAVQAVTKCVAIEISREDFWTWMKSSHTFAILVAKSLASKMYPTIYKNGAAFVYPAKYTIAELLLRNLEDKKDKFSDKEYVGINKTRQQIADELSINVRTVYRSLKALKEEGYITIQKSKIKINKIQYEKLLKDIETFK